MSRIQKAFERLSGEAVPLARVLELACLGLQAHAGCPVTFSCTTPTVDQHVYQVVVEYTEEAVGLRAMELAEQLIAAALADTPFDADAAVTALREIAAGKIGREMLNRSQS